MDVGLQQPKTSQFPWVSHPDAVPVEIWETPPAVRRRRGVSHIPTGCRIQLGFYSVKCDKGGIAFIPIVATIGYTMHQKNSSCCSITVKAGGVKDQPSA